MLEFALIILIKRGETFKNTTVNLKEEKKESTLVMPFKINIQSPTKEKTKDRKEAKYAFSLIHVIDFISFWIHILAFLIFNIIYWNKNLD